MLPGPEQVHLFAGRCRSRRSGCDADHVAEVCPCLCQDLGVVEGLSPDGSGVETSAAPLRTSVAYQFELRLFPERVANT
jgi:hypothetical protein